MATVNKNFRIKNGLIVEGSTATVNGYDLLTKAQADQDYIVNLIGGTATSANTANTVVKRDGSGNFSAGTITATFTGNLTGNVTGDLTGNVTGNVSGSAGTVTSLSGHTSDELSEGTTNKFYTDERAQDAIGNSLGTGLSYNDATGSVYVTANTYDAYGSASAAQSAAASDATTKANAAQSAATSAAASDATTKANAAQSAAITAAATDATTKANAAQSAAEATAAADATTKANAAQSAATSAAASDATTKTNAAVTSANGYTDTAIATEVTNRNSAITSAINTEVSNRNTAISNAVDSLVDGAPALLNTLNELAAAINDDANYTTTITTALGTKAPLESPTFTGTVTLPNNTITQSMMSDDSVGTNEIGGSAVTTAKIADSAVSTAKIADGAVTSAKIEDSAITSGKIANGTIVNEDISASAAIALSKLATDPLARANHTGTQTASTISDFNTAALSATSAAYEAAGAATSAQSAAEGYADGLVSDVLDGTSAFTSVNVNDLVSQRAAQAVLSSIATGSSVMSWAKSDYPTAKLWVKFATATHSQISEILLTTDSSNNIAITDFAETGTNGSLGTISASYLSGNIGVEVSTVYANTTVTVVATLIK